MPPARTIQIGEAIAFVKKAATLSAENRPVAHGVVDGVGRMYDTAEIIDLIHADGTVIEVVDNPFGGGRVVQLTTGSGADRKVYIFDSVDGV